MIEGKVSRNRQATVNIEVADVQGRFQVLEAVFDSDFTGYLTLTADTIQQLELPPVGHRKSELANGELPDFEAFLATLSWHGLRRDALVLKSDSTQLLGMALIWGSRVTLDAMTGGNVAIEALEPASQSPQAA